MRSSDPEQARRRGDAATRRADPMCETPRPRVSVSPRLRYHGTTAAFTLLEVLVALVVVSTAFVGLLGLHNRNLALIGRDQDLTIATLAAREIITQTEFEGFPELGRGGGNLEYHPGFRWEREVTETELPDIREIRLRIIWDEMRPNACELLYYMRDRREPES
jgi:type II secretion system protein I